LLFGFSPPDSDAFAAISFSLTLYAADDAFIAASFSLIFAMLPFRRFSPDFISLPSSSFLPFHHTILLRSAAQAINGTRVAAAVSQRAWCCGKAPAGDV
jgi:hypothetical protein